MLFEVWFPGVREVELTYKLCEVCGFVTYTPRPTALEVDAKYRFLTNLDPDGDALHADSPCESKRARLLFRNVTKYLPRGGRNRILDFGGGDGRLMREFLGRDWGCHVVDYRKDPLPGVERIGTTVADIPVAARFNVIVCSHVIEHVANPLEVVSALKRHLESDGILYIEVPMEVWGRAPVQEEPVTHVNFFTPYSTCLLLERAGMRVLSHRLGANPHASGEMQLVIRATAMPGHPVRRPLACRGSRETEQFLNPSLGLKLKRRLLLPSTIPSALIYKVGGLIRRRHT